MRLTARAWRLSWQFHFSPFLAASLGFALILTTEVTLHPPAMKTNTFKSRTETNQAVAASFSRNPPLGIVELTWLA